MDDRPIMDTSSVHLEHKCDRTRSKFIPDFELSAKCRIAEQATQDRPTVGTACGRPVKRERCTTGRRGQNPSLIHRKLDAVARRRRCVPIAPDTALNITAASPAARAINRSQERPPRLKSGGKCKCSSAHSRRSQEPCAAAKPRKRCPRAGEQKATKISPAPSA